VCKNRWRSTTYTKRRGESLFLLQRFQLQLTVFVIQCSSRKLAGKRKFTAIRYNIDNMSNSQIVRTCIDAAKRSGLGAGVFNRIGSSRSLPSISASPYLQQQASYHEKVIDHYENPRNVGSFDKNDEGVGTGLVGAPACGDVMKLQIKVDADGKIIDAKFKTFGCGSAIASSSLATEWIKGKSVDAAGRIKNTDIAKELCLPPVKLHCSMLAEDAIKAALADYKVKKEANGNGAAKPKVT